jgi:hypothetical protein
MVLRASATDSEPAIVSIRRAGRQDWITLDREEIRSLSRFLQEVTES